MEVSRQSPRENGHLDSWTVRGRPEDERRRPRVIAEYEVLGVRGGLVDRRWEGTSEEENRGWWRSGGFVSHPILVTPSFLTVGWRFYRVTALFLGRPTPSALRKGV